MKQLPLFSPEAEARRTLREQYEHLAADYAALDERYLALWQAHRDLQKAHAQHAGERNTLRAHLADAQAENLRLYRALEEARWQCMLLEIQRQAPAPTASDTMLKQLLRLVHPDLWCRGQPAAELAHELTVHINRLRAEVRP